jgi:hypothetical protein
LGSNLTAARSLGLSVSPSLFVVAEELVE